MAWEVAKGILIAVAILAALALILPSVLNALLPLLQRSRRSTLDRLSRWKGLLRTAKDEPAVGVVLFLLLFFGLIIWVKACNSGVLS